MTAVDTNVLVYAHREEMPLHQAAERCLRLLAESSMPWAIPWPCIHEFLAVVTNRKAFPVPSPMSVAIAQVDAWMQSPSLTMLSETQIHWETLRETITEAGILGPVTHDARIAALCRQHGITRLFSVDRDFSRFPAIKAVNPLV